MYRIFFLLTLLLCGKSLAAQNWPNVEFPKNATVEIVADNMNFNGIPMRTWAVTDQQTSPMLTAAFFRQQWKDSSIKFDEQKFGNDFIINSLQPPYLLTARIKPQLKGVLVYVGISKNEAVTANANSLAFPTLASSTVLSDIRSQDLFKRGRTLLLRSGSDIGSAYRYYYNYFVGQGWTVSGDILDVTAGKGALMLSSGSSTVDITFNRMAGHVSIVANLSADGG